MEVDTPMVAGVVATTVLIVLAIFWQFGSEWRKKADATRKPMTVVLKTEKTPADLYAAARASQFKFRVITGIMVLVFWSVIWLYNPELAVLFRDWVFGTIAAFARGLAALLQYLADRLV